MNKDLIAIQETKSSIAKNKDDFVFILDLLAKDDNTGLLFDFVKACGADSSLGGAVFNLIGKVTQARKNVIPEIDELIKIIEENITNSSANTNTEVKTN